ncbi:MAG: cysteine desulfurase [Pasteurellales bacterium]|nr:MAG: cysteine desulfurase [Pasteurellales bacterium]
MDNIRKHFSALAQDEIVYLDSAATTLKPDVLIQSINDYAQCVGSVHRGFGLTVEFEQARSDIAHYFNLKPTEVIFTSGTTASMNIVAFGLEHLIKQGDSILITDSEHHSNFLPWQRLAVRKKAHFAKIKINKNFDIDRESLINQLDNSVKIVVLHLVSNVTGYKQDIKNIVAKIRAKSSAFIVLDIAQGVFDTLDLKEFDCDFYAFSAHKFYGMTGLGFLLGKESSLEQLEPLFLGGKMVDSVNWDSCKLSKLPHRLEAGTPHILGVLGFQRVLQWYKSFDPNSLNQHLRALTQELFDALSKNPAITLISSADAKNIVTFVVDGISSSDIADILEKQGIIVRVGKLCSELLMEKLGHRSVIRVSLAHYNNKDDIQKFINALDLTLELFE